MALTPETFINYSEDLVEIFQNIETEALTILTKEFSIDLDSDSITSWRARKMSQIQNVNREFALVIAAADTDQEVEDLFVKVYRKGITDTDATVNAAINLGAEVLPVTTTAEQFGVVNVPKLIQVIVDGQQAMNLQKTNMLSVFPSVYQNIINESITLQQSGVLTLDQAVQRTLDKWALKGLPSLVDEAGRVWNSRTYVENYARTNSLSTYRAAEKARQLEYGESLVQISVHADCSDVCRPYQGNIYDLVGESTEYKSIEYAESGGLYHNNCKHFPSPYFKGISQRVEKISADELDESYDELLKQRAIERNIRHWKNRKVTSLSDDALDKANAKVSHWQKEMRSFIDESNRTRRYSREQI